MSKWILLIALFLMPVFAQEERAEKLRAFRQELAAAVDRGSLNAGEKKKYDSALKSIDEAKAAKQENRRVNRLGVRKSMKDLAEISRSENLKAEDRANLAKLLEKAK